MVAVLDEGCESQCLGSTPINTLTFFDRFGSLFEYFTDESVEVHFFGEVRDFGTGFFESRELYPRTFRFILIQNLDFFPFFGDPVFSFVTIRLRLLICLFHFIIDPLFHGVAFIKCHNSFFNKLAFINPSHRRHLFDLLVHHGLRETGLVEFVVAAESVADEVNHNIMLKCLPVICCHFECPVYRFEVVCVHMNNWRIDCFGEVGRVHATSTLGWYSCKTNLIVYDDVDCATNCVVL